MLVWGIVLLCWSNILHTLLSGWTCRKWFLIFSACWCPRLSELSFLSASHQGESLLHSPRTLWPSPFQLSENIKELRFTYFPSFYLLSDLHCTYGLQHFHKHCWAAFGCCPLFLSLQKGTLSQHIVCNVYHWYTPFWRAAAGVSCGRNLCEFVRRLREVQMCSNSNNSFLALLLTEKKILGHYVLGNLCI